MIAIQHRFRDPRTGASFTQDELRADDLIVVRTVHDGGRHDDGAERAVTTAGSSHAIVRFAINGRHRVRQQQREVEIASGAACASRDLRACTLRSITDRSDVLAIVWRKEGAFGRALAGDDRVDLSPAGRAALFDLAATMRARADATVTTDALRRALAALAACGLPVEPSAPLAPASAADGQVARVIERTVFPLTARPMAIDLARALGVGERQALRRVNPFIARYYASGTTWRDYIQAMRIGLSAFFMSHPRARTEHVSALLGFSSPTSFCHALSLAGLPSPGVMQQLSRA